MCLAIDKFTEDLKQKLKEQNDFVFYQVLKNLLLTMIN